MEATDHDTRSPAPKPAAPDLSWSVLLAAYRLGPKERWSGLLLERLGPWLTNARRALVAVPPVSDSDDVAQQLVLEVLGIAARWRATCDDRWIPRKLVEAAARGVRRKLQRERATLAVELGNELAQADDSEAGNVFETPIGRTSAADLRVLFRYEVLGLPVNALAKEAHITPRQMRRRLQLARKRART